MRDPQEKVFILAQATLEERNRLHEVARARGITASKQIRRWINNAHKALEKKNA